MNMAFTGYIRPILLLLSVCVTIVLYMLVTDGTLGVKRLPDHGQHITSRQLQDKTDKTMSLISLDELKTRIQQLTEEDKEFLRPALDDATRNDSKSQSRDDDRSNNTVQTTVKPAIGADHPHSKNDSGIPKYNITHAAPTSGFIIAYGASLYMYSAVARNTSEHTKWDQVIINAWTHLSETNTPVYCCFLHKDKPTTQTSVAEKYEWLGAGRSKLLATQYVCNTTTKYGLIVGISLVSGNDSCPKDNDYYLTPTYPMRPAKPALAICSKTAYGKLDGEVLMEWFELQIRLGVSKILAYTYDLNDGCRRVFDYYKSIGLAETFDFDYPLLDGKKRYLDTSQGYQDQQVTVFDCVERLRGYRYLVVMDTDEYILPRNTTNLFQFVESTYGANSKLASLKFYTRIHAKTWGPTHPASLTYLGRYANSTGPFMNCPKNIFMPTRVEYGSVTTHVERARAGFKSKWIDRDEASIHHFRLCRSEWQKERPFSQVNSTSESYLMKKFPKICDDFFRFQAPEMMQLVATAENDIIRLRSKLNVTLKAL